MAKIAILGAGIMATALTWPLTDNGHEVHLVGTHLDEEIIASITKTRVHPNLGLKVPAGVVPYQLADAARAFRGADVAFSGVNSFGVDFMGEQLAELLEPGMIVLSVTKGMADDPDGNLKILPEVLKTKVGPKLANSCTWAAITGPSIAGEVAVRHDTCVVFCGDDQQTLDYLRDLFATDYYHVWTTTDFVGAEIGAATKNIYAFAAGLGLGLLEREGKTQDRYLRHNYNAAVFAQGQSELRQWVELLGGRPEQADGLCGVGDLFVTSMGGRNVLAGTLVGSGLPFSQVQAGQLRGVTLEGVNAIRVFGRALPRLTERGLVAPEDFPLARYLYRIVEEDAPLALPWTQFFNRLPN